MDKPTYRSTRGTELGNEVEMEIKLKPCAHCGGEAKQIFELRGTNVLNDSYPTEYCECPKCGGKTKIKIWQTRSTPEQVKGPSEEDLHVLFYRDNNEMDARVARFIKDVHKLISGEK